MQMEEFYYYQAKIDETLDVSFTVKKWNGQKWEDREVKTEMIILGESHIPGYFKARIQLELFPELTKNINLKLFARKTGYSLKDLIEVQATIKDNQGRIWETWYRP